jgi:hypothetical protein
MDVGDSQVHLNRIIDGWESVADDTIIGHAISAMDAVGIHAVLIHEHPTPVSVAFADGVSRGAYAFSDRAFARYRDRFRYQVKRHPCDPDLDGQVAHLRKTPGAACLRCVPLPRMGELDLFAAGAHAPLFAAAGRRGVPVSVWLPGRSQLLEP